MNGSIRPSVVTSPLRSPQAAPGKDGEGHGGGQHQMRIGNRARIHEQDHQARDKGEHRADRQIEIARGNDEGRADRDDRHEGAAGRDIRQIVDADEIRIGQRAKHHSSASATKGATARRSISFRSDLGFSAACPSSTLMSKTSSHNALGLSRPLVCSLFSFAFRENRFHSPPRQPLLRPIPPSS